MENKSITSNNNTLQSSPFSSSQADNLQQLRQDEPSSRYANADEQQNISQPPRSQLHSMQYVNASEQSLSSGYENISEIMRPKPHDDQSDLAQLQKNSQSKLLPPSRPTFLTDTFEVTSANHQRYRIYPYVTQAQAKIIEQQYGIVLPIPDDKSTIPSYRAETISGYLGGGQFGRVYVAEIMGQKTEDGEPKAETSVNPPQFCAIKITQGDRGRLIVSAHEEEIQQQLTRAMSARRAHIMPLLDAVKIYDGEELSCLYYVLPLAALGNVSQLREQLSTLESQEFRRLLSWHLAQGLLLGLWQMHQQGIYHLDVKLENLLVVLQGNVLVSDFGTSEKIDGQPALLTPGRNSQGRFIGNGDSTYFSPERSSEISQTYDCAKVDSYAAGLALWELATGTGIESVSDYEEPENLLAKIQGASPVSLADLAKHLLQRDPDQRWSVEQALNHPIFQQPDLHDTETVAVITDFLKRFAQQAQLKKAQDAKFKVSSLNELAKSAQALRQSQRPIEDETFAIKLSELLNPFAKRADIQEQLTLYLPLQGSFAREVNDPAQENFDLAEKAQTFLESDKTLLLILAEGGSGKSLFVQHLTTQLLQTCSQSNNNNDTAKPWLPLYIALGSIPRPQNLLQEGLGLTHENLKALEKDYRLLLIADGYDEQSRWTNLYVQNQLHRYNIKLLVTCRINALPGSYSHYFVPQVPGEPYPRGYQEVYIQPFAADQIETYVQNYVLKERLENDWQDPKAYRQMIGAISGLTDLMKTPLMCLLILEALPELAKRLNNTAIAIAQAITRAEVYEAFLTRWITQQMDKHTTSLAIQAIWDTAHKIVVQLCKETSIQIDLSQQAYRFHPEKGEYVMLPHAWQWLSESQAQIRCLPLQEVSKGQYKFMHLSIQEFLLARYLYQQLKQAKSLKDLAWNQLVLTKEEKDRPILYFLADKVNTDKVFQTLLFQLVEQSKIDKTQARAAANAISVLAAAGSNLCNLNLVGISIPGADLSGAILWQSQLNGADLTGVNLQGANLNEVNLVGANLAGIRLGQLPGIQHKQCITCCRYSSDGRYLAVTTAKLIILYDAETIKEVKRLEGHTTPVYSIAFDPHRERLVSGGGDYQSGGEIILWDLASGKQLLSLTTHNRGVNHVAFDAKGEQIAAAGEDHSVIVWEAATGKQLREIKFSEAVKSLIFDITGRKLITANVLYNHEGEITITDIAAKERDWSKGIRHDRIVNDIALDPTGQFLVSASDDKTVKIWNLAKRKQLHCLPGHAQSVQSVTFDVKGQRLATADGGTKGDSKEIIIWDVATWKELSRLGGHTSAINALAFDPKRERLASSGGYDYSVRIWNLAMAKGLKPVFGHTHSVYVIAFDKQGRYLASAGVDKIIHLWELATGKKLASLKGHQSIVRSLQFNPQGTQLVSGGSQFRGRITHGKTGEIILWDVVLAKQLHHWGFQADKVSFNETGKCIISASDTGNACVWEIATGKSITEIRWRPAKYRGGSIGPSASAIAINLTADLIASGNDEGEIIFCEVKTGQEIKRLKVKDRIQSVVFDPTGKWLASASHELIRIWEVTSGKEVSTFTHTGGDCIGLDFDANSQRLVAVSRDKSIKVWEVATGNCLLTKKFIATVNSATWVTCQGEQKLALTLHKAVAVFSIQEVNDILQLRIDWMVNAEQNLEFTGAEVTQVTGLNGENWTLLQQLGAQGTPSEIEEVLTTTFNSSKPSFDKPALNPSTPPSLLFTLPKAITPQATFQAWAQTTLAQGSWTVECNGQNLLITYVPQHKGESFTLLLTQLHSHLSQLPEWQQVVAHQQEGNALLIRLQSEANAQAYEAPLKDILGIEEFGLKESCLIS